MDKRLTILSGLLIVWCCALNTASLAAALSQGDVPQPLKPWIKWAVFDDKQRQCPFLYNSFKTKRCA